MKFLENIFSVKNNQTHKIITILGIRLKFKNLNKIIQSQISIINNLECQNFCLQKEKDSLIYNCVQMTLDKNKTNVYFLNDTSQYDNEHLGCSLISKTFKNLCVKNNMKAYFCDGSFDLLNIDVQKYKPIIEKCDILIFNGEGTLHDEPIRTFNLMEKCKLAKELGKKVVLINSVWQNNPSLYKYLPFFDLISVRESLSKEEILKNINVNVEVVPDLIFYNNECLRQNSNNLNEHYIFTDSVNSEITKKIKNLSSKYNADFYYMDNLNTPKLTLDILKQGTRVVTGRFHALALCLMLGIPCLAIQSNTHKIEGLLSDADLMDYFVDINCNIENAMKNFFNKDHSLYIYKSAKYSTNAKLQIAQLFNKIQEIMKGEE